MYRIHIEKATLSDAGQILAIQKVAYRSEAEIYDDYRIPPLTQSLTEIESDFHTHVFYVAKMNGEIVGSVNIKAEGNRGIIGRLAVMPNLQSQGIGGMLMEHVEANHGDLETFELFTGHKSERNLSFYSKRGYQECRRLAVNEKLEFVFMFKKNAKKSFPKFSSLTSDSSSTEI
jgi:N-acetylglutamate synthase-like GNAT family acetyltransferase